MSALSTKDLVMAYVLGEKLETRKGQKEPAVKKALHVANALTVAHAAPGSCIAISSTVHNLQLLRECARPEQVRQIVSVGCIVQKG